MITGYNTDVRHNEVVFHVQTEDKGLANPFIESLVYVGGQVLASKRAGYAELLAEGKEEKDIVALMDHQHRTMIAAIRHGKLDARLAELFTKGQTGQHPKAQTSTSTAAQAAVPEATEIIRAQPVTAVRPATPLPPPPVPPPSLQPSRPVPASAPARERTLDQVILEYLTSEADQEQLVLMVEGEPDLGLGRRAAITLRTSSSKSGAPVVGAQVSVRMISTVTEPRILATGRTNDDGLLPLAFEIPHLGRGTAALIITASSNIGRAELKHLL